LVDKATPAEASFAAKHDEGASSEDEEGSLKEKTA
jgi:hypothetical protein